VADVSRHWEHLDGAMIGREAYHNPYILAEALPLFGMEELPTRGEILARYLHFMEAELVAGCPLSQMTRHILGLFQGQPGARRWRQHISENAHIKGSGTEVVIQAARFAGIEA